MAASYPYKVKNSSLNYFTVIEETRAHKWDISMFSDFMVFYLLEKSNEVFIYLFVFVRGNEQ